VYYSAAQAAGIAFSGKCIATLRNYGFKYYEGHYQQTKATTVLVNTADLHHCNA
jgi:hypothetical protein